MEIPDKGRAIHYLAHFNYFYRLGGYWLPFEKECAIHEFRPDTSFEKRTEPACFRQSASNSPDRRYRNKVEVRARRIDFGLL